MKGAAELISFVLTIAIILAGIGAVLFIGNPIVDRSEAAATISESKSILNTVDSVLREIIYERSGSTRVIPITVSGGEYTVDSEDNYIEFFLETEDRFIEPSSQTKDGNRFTAARRDVKAYTGTVNSQDALILENSHTWFAIKWVNETTPLSSYDTTDMIILLGNKDEPHNETFADSSVFIDGLPNTNTGTGWSELVYEDGLYGVGEAKVHMFSDEGTNYTITFSLRSDADYVLMEVTDITGNKNNVTGTLSFAIEDSSTDTITNGDNFISADNTSTVVGILEDGTPLDKSSGTFDSSNYQLNMTQSEATNRFYYIISEGDNSTIDDADIDDIDDFSGAFGYSFSQDEKYYSWLEYDIVDVVSNLTFGKGDYQLILKNEGISNNKVQLNVTLK